MRYRFVRLQFDGVRVFVETCHARVGGNRPTASINAANAKATAKPVCIGERYQPLVDDEGGDDPKARAAARRLVTTATKLQPKWLRSVGTRRYDCNEQEVD